MITIGRLRPEDRGAWETLFRAYIEFYERTLPQESYDRAWREFQRDERMHALGAYLSDDDADDDPAGDRLVGIVHFLVHANTSAPDVCYLQDLFTAPEARRTGVGRALIEAVARRARELGCGRVYWHTKETNLTARRLYDQVAQYSGFIQYRMDL